MKKVICSACGLVNLDKFTTFPHCAACGARLPEAPPRRPLFWKRRVAPALWGSVVALGIATLAIGIIGVVRDTREGFSRLAVVVRVPSRVRLNQPFQAQFLLDSRALDPAPQLQEVRLRWGREMERDFRIIGAQPKPDVEERVGSGRYLLWNELARGASIRLSLAPRRVGTLAMRVGAYARDHDPLEARASVRVVR